MIDLEAIFGADAVREMNNRNDGPRRVGEILWQAMPDCPEKYQRYLCSREWAELRRQVLGRAAGRCERCGVNQPEVVHHLTYARKYHEDIGDLAAWCYGCHEFTHGKRDDDPKQERQKVLGRQRRLETALHPWPYIGDKEQTLFVCPECECECCHFRSLSVPPHPDAELLEIVITMWCEENHEWEVILSYHKGTSVGYVSGLRDILFVDED